MGYPVLMVRILPLCFTSKREMGLSKILMLDEVLLLQTSFKITFQKKLEIKSPTLLSVLLADYTLANKSPPNGDITNTNPSPS